ncbi:hypothetical protein EI555_006511 [Monodon monoceros]|uniref:ubiquitinyl hydrolase 1 n=1 Tax=Monodon monoceros TaxID=40151 RepID=A0A4U1EB42_MONMO|nr:hypothetical protein EI555_006511 [Monodon monoceros]
MNYLMEKTIRELNLAPEFILICTAFQKIPDEIDTEVNCSSTNYQYPGSAFALDGSTNVEVEVLENDGILGGLGQRERKKKTKTLLERSQRVYTSTEALVNGHVNPRVQNSVSAEDAKLMGDVSLSGAPRTCGSPQDATDFSSDAVPSGSFLEPSSEGQDCRGSMRAACRHSCQQGGVAHCASSDMDPEKAKSTSPPADAQASVYSPPATSTLVSKKEVEVKEGLVPVSEDPVAIKIAELLENVTLIHKPVSLQPRGLINKGNLGYINATLQALVACPLMYHLMKFIPLYSKCLQNPDKLLGIMRDTRPGAAFEPTYTYRLLRVIKSSLSEKGHQKDAEEYLGFILNGLYEEMLNLKKLLSANNEKLTISNGPKSHSVDFVQTSIAGIFGEHIRSVVYQQSSEVSATVQPFFTLQLDIQLDKICTVQDALESLGLKNKNFKCHRAYRLFAVVYHHSSSNTGGHYNMDVFQIGLNGWLHINDQMVKAINKYQVLKPTTECTAYFLYYCHVDLL